MQDSSLNAPLNVLDEESFQEFAPLLAACQQYAKNNRYVFRASDFANLPTDLPTPATSAVCNDRELDTHLQARLQAAPIVSEFSHRLRSAFEAGVEGTATDDQQLLLDQVDQAFRYLIKQSVRNNMKGICVGLSLYPPPNLPAGVDEYDCSYQDTSAALPEIAQRLYNEEQMRQSSGVCASMRLRANTAQFILDFAEETGVAMPEIPAQYRDMFAEFEQRVEEWQGDDDTYVCIEGNGVARLQSAVRGRLAQLPSYLSAAGAVATNTAKEAFAETSRFSANVIDAIPFAQEALAEPAPAMPIHEYAEQLDVDVYELMFHY